MEVVVHRRGRVAPQHGDIPACMGPLRCPAWKVWQHVEVAVQGSSSLAPHGRWQLS